MNIDIEILRKSTERLLNYLEEQGHKTIELKEDYYWSIDKTELYNPFEDPKNFSIGQLYDDYEYLAGIADNTKDPIAFGLVWLSAVYRYIGEEIIS